MGFKKKKNRPPKQGKRRVDPVRIPPGANPHNDGKHPHDVIACGSCGRFHNAGNCELSRQDRSRR